MSNKSSTSGKSDAASERQPLRQPLPPDTPAKADADGVVPDDLVLFGQRLRIASVGMDPTDISVKTGVERRSIVNYLAGKNDPSRARVVQLAKALAVNVDWLATGEGAMVKKSVDWPASDLGRAQLGRPRRPLEMREPPPDAYLTHAASAGEHLPPGFVLVPRYDVRAAAGRGAINETEDLIDRYAYRDSFIKDELKASPAGLCIIDAVGDSMEPQINDGDQIMVDLSVKRFIGDGIYVVRFEGGLLVKQVQKMPGGTLRLVSHNRNYEPHTVNERAAEFGQDFAIIGRALGKPGFTKF